MERSGCMSEEIKKENKSGMSRPESHDNVTDGFFDLDTIYSKETKKKPIRSREDELRIKEARLKAREEARRKLEMQAIREDIERRYSLQLEDAQSKIEPEKKEEKRSSLSSKLMPEIDEHEVVREELEHIDSIINADTPAEEEAPVIKKSVRKKKEKVSKTKTKKEETFDLSEESTFYSLFYNFGNTIYDICAYVFGLVFRIIRFPFARIYKAFSRATEKTKKNVQSRIRATLREIVNFRSEIKAAGKTIKSALRKPLTIPKVLARYVKEAFSRHDNLLRTVFNYLLPLASLAVLLVTINYWNSVTFALEVIYNGQISCINSYFGLE